MSVATIAANIVYNSVSTLTGLFSALLVTLGLKKARKDPELIREQMTQFHQAKTPSTPPPSSTSDDETSFLERITGLEKLFYAGSPFSKIPLTPNDLQILKQKHGARITEFKHEISPGRNLEAFQIEPQTNYGKQAFVVLSGIRSSAKFKIPAVDKLIESQIPVIIGNYTGTGSSHGLNISHATITKDAKMLIEKALDKHHKLGTIGHSLGSAVSARVLAQLSESRPQDLFGDMVMVSPWNKFSDVISTYPGPWLKPLSALLGQYSNQVLYNKQSGSNVWDTGINVAIAIRNIAQYLETHNVPAYQKLRIHLFHGTHDSVVRIEQAQALMKHVQAQIKQLPPRIQKHFEINLYPIEGGDHFTDLQQSKLPMPEIISALNNK